MSLGLLFYPKKRCQPSLTGRPRSTIKEKSKMVADFFVNAVT